MKNKIAQTVIMLLAMITIRTANAQSIIGGWYGEGQGQAHGAGVLSFLPNGTYYFADTGDSNADPSGTNGVEQGTYTWNATTGAFSALTQINTDGQWGLSDVGITNITVTGDTLTLFSSFEIPHTLTRVRSTTSAIVGSWYFANQGQSQGYGVVSFLTNGTYYLADTGNHSADPSGNNGVEKGTYTWDPATGTFSSITQINTDGHWGFSDPGITKITVAGSQMTVFTPNGQATATAVLSGGVSAHSTSQVYQIQMTLSGLVEPPNPPPAYRKVSATEKNIISLALGQDPSAAVSGHQVLAVVSPDGDGVTQLVVYDTSARQVVVLLGTSDGNSVRINSKTQQSVGLFSLSRAGSAAFGINQGSLMNVLTIVGPQNMPAVSISGTVSGWLNVTTTDSAGGGGAQSQTIIFPKGTIKATHIDQLISP